MKRVAHFKIMLLMLKFDAFSERGRRVLVEYIFIRVKINIFEFFFIFAIQLTHIDLLNFYASLISFYNLQSLARTLAIVSLLKNKFEFLLDTYTFAKNGANSTPIELFVSTVQFNCRRM